MNNSKQEKQQYVGYWLHRFFIEFLTVIRNMSTNTITSYRDTFKLMLPMIAEATKKSADNVAILDLTYERITDFLSYIEKERNCSIRTRNQRLAAIKAFANYVAMQKPEYLDWCRITKSIPAKKMIKKEIQYLEKNEMNAILNAPSKKTRQGIRDFAILLFMYNTGARADEVASLKIRDIYLPNNKKETPFVRIIGKGNKERRCPLWKKTCDTISLLIDERDSNSPVFLNRYNEPITRFGIYEMVHRYALVAAAKIPSIAEKTVTPHSIRHTTATHLLQSGVDIDTIRKWLGHVSIDTTNIYAEINMEMKAAALKKCEEPVISTPKKKWSDNKDLMSFLDSL